MAGTSDVNETAKAVIDALDRTSLAWLLVFDNAEQAGDLTDWLPQSGMGHVIATSRQTGWDALGSNLNVDVFAPFEAIALLRRRVSVVTESDAAAIVEQLGYLPLAVEQAAAYIAETGTTPTDYLTLLRAQGEALLDQGYARGYEHTVATVWHISQASLRLASPGAERILQYCAFLGPEAIPVDLFTSHPGLLPGPLTDLASDPLRFNAAVGGLPATSGG